MPNDAPVLVNRDDAVTAGPGGLGGTHPDAGRVVAVVAEHGHAAATKARAEGIRVLDGERPLERLLPDPLHFVPHVGDSGHIVCVVAGVDAGPAPIGGDASRQIDGDAEPPASHGVAPAAERRGRSASYGGAAREAKEHSAARLHGCAPVPEPGSRAT